MAFSTTVVAAAQSLTPDLPESTLAAIPSPAQGVWHLGPLPLRAYAVCILLGIGVAMWVSNKRWTERGGDPSFITDVAVWAVPFGVLGGRLYHVVTTPGRYFGENGDPAKIFAIWEGGLGIWGAIALGALGAWIACRRRAVPLSALGDAIAPGLALAQAIGRWGNWFNQELYGRPTSQPWALEIDPAHREAAFIDQATYHPTFLYESVWNIGVAVLVIWAHSRFRLNRGRVFALYVMAYCVGRLWIEMLRVDTAEHIMGLRLNVWTSILVFLGALLYFLVVTRQERAEGASQRVVSGHGQRSGRGASAGYQRRGEDPTDPSHQRLRGEQFESSRYPQHPPSSHAPGRYSPRAEPDYPTQRYAAQDYPTGSYPRQGQAGQGQVRKGQHSAQRHQERHEQHRQWGPPRDQRDHPEDPWR